MTTTKNFVELLEAYRDAVLAANWKAMLNRTTYDLQEANGECDSAQQAAYDAFERVAEQRLQLLAACKALLPEGWPDGTMDHMPGVKIARLAIAKAEA